MKVYIKVSILLLITLSNVESFAQQDPQFSQYMFNGLFLNPAYAGVEGVTKAQVLYRQQWAGYTSTFDGSGGAPVTQMVSFVKPLSKYGSGVGIHLVNDKLGPLRNSELQISYAYKIGFAGGDLNIGLRAGIFSQTIDFNQFRPVDQNDPLLIGGKESQSKPDLAFGVYYYSSNFYAGASINHLLGAKFDFGSEAIENPLENHLNLTAGYHLDLSRDLTISPSFLVKSDINTISFDLSVIGTYQDRMWAGLSYRQEEAVIGILGYSLLKDNSLKLGYSIDLVTNGKEAKQATSHEIMLSYTIPGNKVVKKRSIIRTPRFRY